MDAYLKLLTKSERLQAAIKNRIRINNNNSNSNSNSNSRINNNSNINENGDYYDNSYSSDTYRQQQQQQQKKNGGFCDTTTTTTTAKTCNCLDLSTVTIDMMITEKRLASLDDHLTLRVREEEEKEEEVVEVIVKEVVEVIVKEEEQEEEIVALSTITKRPPDSPRWTLKEKGVKREEERIENKETEAEKEREEEVWERRRKKKKRHGYILVTSEQTTPPDFDSNGLGVYNVEENGHDSQQSEMTSQQQLQQSNSRHIPTIVIWPETPSNESNPVQINIPKDTNLTCSNLIVTDFDEVEEKEKETCPLSVASVEQVAPDQVDTNKNWLDPSCSTHHRGSMSSETSVAINPNRFRKDSFHTSYMIGMMAKASGQCNRGDGDDDEEQQFGLNPLHPTTGLSIKDLISMTPKDYLELKEVQQRRLSDEILPSRNARKSYCRMLDNSQNGSNDPETASKDSQSFVSGKGRKGLIGLKRNRQQKPHLDPSSEEQTKKEMEANMKSVRDGFFIIMSGMYGLVLVVLGAVIPISEAFSDIGTPYFFDAFYIYLYIASCLFILYVYTFLLRRNKKAWGNMFPFYRTWSRQWSRNWSFGRRSEKNGERSDSRRRHKTTTDREPHNPNGSFYLRLGAIGFGIGGMIHSGLQLGQHFQVIDGSYQCDGVMQVIKPLFHLAFTFVQLYFVFLNPKVCIHRYKTLARFGLMHMCGTNICVWFRNIVVETLHEMHNGEHLESYDHGTSHHTSGEHRNVSHFMTLLLSTADTQSHHLVPTSKCHWNQMMGKVVEQAGPYLYPCSIEYSLICAGIMFVLWQQVGRGPKPPHKKRPGDQMDDDAESRYGRAYRLSVDCGGSSRGLFVGILLFVGAVITMVAFYVLVHKQNMAIRALALVHLSEILIYMSGVIATVAAAWRMRGLCYKPGRASVLENVLVLISLTGVFIFCLFGIIAAIFHEENGITNVLSIASNLMMIIQSMIQTVFMAVGSNMKAFTPSQERRKPGREFVTFLILCNLSLWGINTFETQRAEHNPIQTLFYGHMAWAILTHISVPLGIFFRFHSTVCLSNIWKNAWKVKNH